MTALPPDVSWHAPVRGAFTRHLRFGEWISEPVTPLFESWLLTAMEDRMHACLDAWTGQRAPRPFHVVVNGWYFYSLGFLSGRGIARSMPTMLRRPSGRRAGWPGSSRPPPATASRSSSGSGARTSSRGIGRRSRRRRPGSRSCRSATGPR